MKADFRRRLQERLVSAPSILWLGLFFLVPTLLVFILALRPANPFGGIGTGWTPVYLVVARRTLEISLATTVICLVLAVPVGYTLARVSPKWRNFFLMLVVIPFWTNFLIRVFAWKTLRHPEGPVKQALVFLGVVSPGSSLLYRPGAVILVSVYTFLPFTILPIYAAAEKFDFRLMEAARDLGARPFFDFRKVFIPGIRRGLVTAVLFVFIPALGSYVIPDIVGGPGGEMIGNKIAQRVFVDRNLPLASALSVVLILSVLAPLIAILFLQRKSGKPEIL